MSVELSDIQKHYTLLTQTFTNSPRSKDESKALLKKFRDSLSRSFEPIADAMKKDFNKPRMEVYLTEFGQAVAELNNVLVNLDAVLKPTSPSSLPINFSTLAIKVEKIALGTVLIISPFNYPLILAISPLIGAIAGGNNVILKLPFDQLPNFSTVMKNVIESALPKDQIFVINGGIPESEYLLNECKFDKIFFTGSTNVGKIVYEAASKNLTPVVLELGGKSPAFVTKNIDKKSIRTLLDRLLWGKFTNSGQTCVAPDYLLVEESIYDDVLETLLKSYQSTYANVNENSDFTHIINKKGFLRLDGLIKQTKGKVIAGGKTIEGSLFIEPTIVAGVSWDDPLMSNEIFGPILPIIKYSGSFQNIVQKVARTHDCPLTAYLFSFSDQDLLILKKYLRSGSITVNETLMSAGCFISPFGGIGNSGFGNYHSKWTVNSFTHERSVLKQPLWAEILLKARYFPYTQANMNTLKMLEIIPELPIQKIKDYVCYLLIFLIGWFLAKAF